MDENMAVQNLGAVPSVAPVEVSQKRFKIPTLPPRFKKIFIIFAILIILLVIIGILAPFLGKFVKKNMPAATPTPELNSVSPTPSASPSVYANDPEIANIEEKLNKLDEDFSKVDFREDELRLPSLDFDVSFKK